MRWLSRLFIGVLFVVFALFQGIYGENDHGEEEVLQHVVESYSGNQMRYMDITVILNDPKNKTTEKDWIVKAYRDDQFLDVYIAYAGDALGDDGQMLNYHINNDYVSVEPGERYNSIYRLDDVGDWIPISEATYSGSGLSGYSSIISSLADSEHYMFITYYRMSIDDLSAFNESTLKVIISHQMFGSDGNPLSVVKFIIAAIIITVIFCFQAVRRNNVKIKTSKNNI